MIGVIDYGGIALLVAAIGGAVSSVIAAVGAVVAARRAGKVRAEVRTWNEQSLGQLGAAEETRRVELIAPEDRTARESRHLTQDRHEEAP